MKKQLFTALYIVVSLIVGLKWVLFPELTKNWVIQIFGVVFILEALVKSIEFYMKHKGSRFPRIEITWDKTLWAVGFDVADDGIDILLPCIIIAIDTE